MRPGIFCINPPRFGCALDVQNHKRARTVGSKRARKHDETLVEEFVNELGMFIPQLLFANSF